MRTKRIEDQINELKSEVNGNKELTQLLENIQTQYDKAVIDIEKAKEKLEGWIKEKENLENSLYAVSPKEMERLEKQVYRDVADCFSFNKQVVVGHKWHSRDDYEYPVYETRSCSYLSSLEGLSRDEVYDKLLSPEIVKEVKSAIKYYKKLEKKGDELDWHWDLRLENREKFLRPSKNGPLSEEVYLRWLQWNEDTQFNDSDYRKFNRPNSPVKDWEEFVENYPEKQEKIKNLYATREKYNAQLESEDFKEKQTRIKELETQIDKSTHLKDIDESGITKEQSEEIIDSIVNSSTYKKVLANKDLCEDLKHFFFLTDFYTRKKDEKIDANEMKKLILDCVHKDLSDRNEKYLNSLRQNNANTYKGVDIIDN